LVPPVVETFPAAASSRGNSTPAHSYSPASLLDFFVVVMPRITAAMNLLPHFPPDSHFDFFPTLPIRFPRKDQKNPPNPLFPAPFLLRQPATGEILLPLTRPGVELNLSPPHVPCPFRFAPVFGKLSSISLLQVSEFLTTVSSAFFQADLPSLSSSWTSPRQPVPTTQIIGYPHPFLLWSRGPNGPERRMFTRRAVLSFCCPSWGSSLSPG